MLGPPVQPWQGRPLQTEPAPAAAFSSGAGGAWGPDGPAGLGRGALVGFNLCVILAPTATGTRDAGASLGIHPFVVGSTESPRGLTPAGATRGRRGELACKALQCHVLGGISKTIKACRGGGYAGPGGLMSAAGVTCTDAG